MYEFEHRQAERELSLASLARLESLLRSLRAAANQPVDDLPELEWRHWLRRRSYWRKHALSGPMVILEEHAAAAREMIGAIEESVQTIAGRLDSRWQRSEIDAYEGDNSDADSSWALGVVTFCVERLQILRGDIELRKTEPIAAGIPDEVVAFLVTVPGTRDQITRENHGHWGYHYHYLDSKGRRSDTLLTFDHASRNAATPNLCWEKHAEGDKFKARAGAWGSDKRQSVYTVCHPHALSFGLLAFKRPASDAEIVWPLAVAVNAKPSVSVLGTQA